MTGGALRVSRVTALAGPSIYAGVPVVCFRVHASGAVPVPALTSARDTLAEYLSTAPEVVEGRGRRSAGGLEPALLVAHVALGLQRRFGSRLELAGAEEAAPPCGFVAYEDPAAGIAAVRTAAALVEHALNPTTETADEVASRLRAFDRSALDRILSAQGQEVLQEASRRDIPVLKISQRILQLGHGSAQCRLKGSASSKTNTVASELVSKKDITHRMLAEAGLPSPEHARVNSPDQAVRAAERLGGPVVVKPLRGNHGDGITIGCRTAAEVRAAFTAAGGSRALVETFVPGDDHRLLVVDGRLVAAVRRVPAHVVGDGEATIAQLVDRANADPRRGAGHRTMETLLSIDADAERVLGQQGHLPDSVLGVDEIAYLRRVANLSAGGTTVDVTDEVHPDVRAVAERAARVFGVDTAGVDFLTTDITRSFLDTGGAICEINTRPGLRAHLWPRVGRPRDVIGAIFDMHFPGGGNGRIPTVLVTGCSDWDSAGKAAATLLGRPGTRVGLAGDRGLHIDGVPVACPPAGATTFARALLLDAGVQAAVLTVGPAGILADGLVVDAADVVALTSVAPDASRRERRALQLALSVARRAVVVNADDPASVRLSRDVGTAAVCLVSAAESPQLRGHLADGGCAGWRRPDGDVEVHVQGTRAVLSGLIADAGDVSSPIGLVAGWLASDGAGDPRIRVDSAERAGAIGDRRRRPGADASGA